MNKTLKGFILGFTAAMLYNKFLAEKTAPFIGACMNKAKTKFEEIKNKVKQEEEFSPVVED